MDRYARRRRALIALIEGPRFRGVKKRFAVAAGIDATSVSRLISGKPPKDGGKNLGEDLVERIEERLSIPGYFDAFGTEAAEAAVVVATREEPPAYHRRMDVEHDPLELLMRRARLMDEGLQMGFANLFEAINAAIREARKAPPPPPPKPPKRPKASK